MMDWYSSFMPRIPEYRTMNETSLERYERKAYSVSDCEGQLLIGGDIGSLRRLGDKIFSRTSKS
jgi:hypothetical protein